MISFQQQLENVLKFFEPENLAKQKIKYEGEIALLVIDVQKEFCDPNGKRGNEETEKISERIQSLAPEFRKAGIPVYAIYFASDRIEDPAEIDFYKFTPGPDDMLIHKNTDSAFKSSDIKEVLRKDERKLLLACGFNLSACVMRTVLDARDEGFEVCVIRDLTGNDKCNSSESMLHALKEFGQEDVAIEQSAAVLDYIHARKNAAAAP